MGKIDFGPLQQHHWSQGDPTGWFEPAYAQANGDRAAIPWAEKGINPHLIGVPLEGAGLSALVVGCGLGDDAEYLASRGFAVTAFDISPTAIAWCRRRFPHSPVNYLAADLFQHSLPAFDFVLEAYTLQALPRSLRAQAISAIAALVKQRLSSSAAAATNRSLTKRSPGPSLAPNSPASPPQASASPASKTSTTKKTRPAAASASSTIAPSHP